MRLSFSILLLVAAATQINAAAVGPRGVNAAACIPGSSGKGNGDGYKGYCCTTEADCIDDCVNGQCVGPVNTKTTTKTTTTKTGTKTTTATTTPTTGACIPGSSGLGNGDGYNGYCCKTNNDCWEACISGKCNGPTNTKTTTTKTSTTTTATSTPTGGVCTPGSSGKGNGDGFGGYCCKSSDDCIDSCISGKCNGPTNTKTTTTTKTATKTTTATTTPTTGACSGGKPGLGDGSGKTGACCKADADCQDTCNEGGICGVAP